MATKTNKDLQQELDVLKWDESIKNDTDMCGKMPYCPHCEMEPEFPCAKAYRRARKAQKAVATPTKAPSRKKKA